MKKWLRRKLKRFLKVEMVTDEEFINSISNIQHSLSGIEERIVTLESEIEALELRLENTADVKIDAERIVETINNSPSDIRIDGSRMRD